MKGPIQDLSLSVYPSTSDGLGVIKTAKATTKNKPLLGLIHLIPLDVITPATLVWEGWIDIKEDGDYIFFYVSNYQSLLKINDKEVIIHNSNRIDQIMQPTQSRVSLTKGKAHIELQYLYLDDRGWLDLFYLDPIKQKVQLSKK